MPELRGASEPVVPSLPWLGLTGICPEGGCAREPVSASLSLDHRCGTGTGAGPVACCTSSDQGQGDFLPTDTGRARWPARHRPRRKPALRCRGGTSPWGDGWGAPPSRRADTTGRNSTSDCPRIWKLQFGKDSGVNGVSLNQVGLDYPPYVSERLPATQTPRPCRDGECPTS